MSGNETVTYTFTDPNDPSQDIVAVVVNETPTSVSGASGVAYDVVSISGSIDGASITGAVGTLGAVTTSPDGKFYIDNALFLGQGGVDGNSSGLDNDGLLFQTANGEYNLFSNGAGGSIQLISNGTDYPGGFTVSDFTASNDAPCFCAGTMVATPDGDVAVETLAAGDTVLTTAGEHRPIRWIGHRAVATRFADPISAMPVRIKEGALEDNVPARDMLLSPCHALLVDGVLIQAGALVNGVSIVRESAMPETFTYYHIELADHVLILADGTPAETFIDNIDRMAFDNWEEHRTIAGDAPEMAEMAIPRAKSARQVPAVTRARLAARARVETAAAA